MTGLVEEFKYEPYKPCSFDMCGCDPWPHSSVNPVSYNVMAFVAGGVIQKLYGWKVGLISIALVYLVFLIPQVMSGIAYSWNTTNVPIQISTYDVPSSNPSCGCTHAFEEWNLGPLTTWPSLPFFLTYITLFFAGGSLFSQMYKNNSLSTLYFVTVVLGLILIPALPCILKNIYPLIINPFIFAGNLIVTLLVGIFGDGIKGIFDLIKAVLQVIGSVIKPIASALKGIGRLFGGYEMPPEKYEEESKKSDEKTQQKYTNIHQYMMNLKLNSKEL